MFKKVEGIFTKKSRPTNSRYTKLQTIDLLDSSSAESGDEDASSTADYGSFVGDGVAGAAVTTQGLDNDSDDDALNINYDNLLSLQSLRLHQSHLRKASCLLFMNNPSKVQFARMIDTFIHAVESKKTVGELEDFRNNQIPAFISEAKQIKGYNQIKKSLKEDVLRDCIQFVDDAITTLREATASRQQTNSH